jgi:opine dehydrogenase
MENLRFAIIGAGNGGQSIAGVLAHKGYEVNLFDIDSAKIETIKKLGGINFTGKIEGFGQLKTISDHIEQTVRDVEVIIVVTTAAAYKDVARSCAPHLKEDQLIVLMPGYLGGSLEFSRILKEKGVDCESLIISETESLIYSCRAKEVGSPRIHGIKDKLSMAAFPSKNTNRAIQRLREVYPQLAPAKNVFETGFNNVNPMLHIPITIFNLGRVERGEDWTFYPVGATPVICKYIEKIDQERISLAKILGVKAISTKEILKKFYGVDGEDLYESIHKNQAYQVSKGPTTIHYRYFYEDVPMGLVPISSLGEMLEVYTPCTKTLIHVASILSGVDYWNSGMTIERMGVKGKSVDAIKKFLSEGDDS